MNLVKDWLQLINLGFPTKVVKVSYRLMYGVCIMSSSVMKNCHCGNVNTLVVSIGQRNSKLLLYDVL